MQDETKRSKTPKVINFSFGFGSPSFNKNEEGKVIVSKFNFLDFSSGKMSSINQNDEKNSKSKNDSRSKNFSQ